MVQTTNIIEEIALYAPAVVHSRAGFSALTVALSGAHMGHLKLSTEIAHIFISRTCSTRLLVETWISITRCTIFPPCSPTMKVTIRANHCSNIFGVSNNLRFTELFTILRDPILQRVLFFVAILNQTAFAIIQIEAGNDPQNGMQVPVRTSILQKMERRRDRQRKRVVRAGRNPGCLGSSG